MNKTEYRSIVNGRTQRFMLPNIPVNRAVPCLGALQLLKNFVGDPCLDRKAKQREIDFVDAIFDEIARGRMPDSARVRIDWFKQKSGIACAPSCSMYMSFNDGTYINYEERHGVTLGANGRDMALNAAMHSMSIGPVFQAEALRRAASGDTKGYNGLCFHAYDWGKKDNPKHRPTLTCDCGGDSFVSCMSMLGLKLDYHMEGKFFDGWDFSKKED